MFNIRLVRDAVVNVLKAANTTTASYDLSSSLTSRIPQDSIAKGNPQLAIPNTLYPYILVEPARWKEEHALIGNNARRDLSLAFRIHLATINGGGLGAAQDEIYILTENVLTVMRNNVDLSSTVDWQGNPDVEWGGAAGANEGTYVGSAVITFEAEARSRS